MLDNNGAILIAIFWDSVGGTVEFRYRLKYEGAVADQNVLPAHAGAQSLEGITWSFSLLTNYLVTGEIRHRGALDPRMKVYISPPARGSFITDVTIFLTQPESLFLTSVLGTYAVSTAGNAFNSFVTYAFKRVCGVFDQGDEDMLKALNKFPSGDLEANLDAIEPSMTRAHSVIGDGAERLLITKPRAPVTELNGTTKAYIQTDQKADDPSEHEVGVGALNVNQGSGRVFFQALGKTVPFQVVKEPDAGTYTTLSWSLDQYARGLESTIKIKCIEVYSIDGRIKRFIILSATRI
ncbi:MAG: hypothetical protein EOS71_03675 [Mesorhizobium sp.]|nr:hypothetical protein EOA35_26920 [Mesorhizobium sp. M8A.F.Ca.ET.023.01.1.1]RWC78332.1 MAG: hypothetical protein EOS71_03675 [Mesorhizobium sp.]